MISSAKMHKAELALKQLRPFRDQVETVIANLLSSDASFSSPLMEERPVARVALVVWGSDDGLCGAYNVNIFKLLLQRIAELRSQLGDAAEIDVLAVGSKMAKAVGKLRLPGVKGVAAQGVDSKSADTAVRDFTFSLRDAFLSGSYDRVDMLYMSFKSVSRQRPEFQQLLPVSYSAFRPEPKDVQSSLISSSPTLQASLPPFCRCICSRWYPMFSPKIALRSRQPV